MSQDDREVRKATVTDAPRIACMHVASWLETYAGIVPEQMLAAQSVPHRTVAWEHILRDPASHGNTVVYLKELGDDIVGFGACSEQRDTDLKVRGFDGEIGSVYVLRAHQKQGIGRGLLSALARDLLGRGFNGVALWVLQANIPARRFYERCAGQVVGQRNELRGNAVLVELAYGWSRIEQLTFPR